MRVASLLSLVVAVVGCGGGAAESAATTSAASTSTATATTSTSDTTTTTTEAPPDVTPPSVAYDLGRYDVVRGTTTITADAKDDTAVARVALTVDGVEVAEATQAPFAIAWDSTKVEDGVRAVGLVAYDAAGNQGKADEVPVIVVNQGSTPVFDESKSAVDGTIEGTFKVPANWNGNDEQIDKKFHFAVPEKRTRLVAVLAWDGGSGFDINFSTGTGWCPDSGVLKKKTIESDGEALIEVEAPKGLDVTGWFIHVGGENAADMKGKSVKFTARVAILP